MVNPHEDQLPPENELLKQIMMTIDNVWHNNLSKKDIEKWLANFTGKVFSLKYERQLALYLLANFVYFNDTEVRYLCRIMYRDFVHQTLISSNLHQTSNITLELDNITFGTKFCHLGKTGESGQLISYFFRQENKIGINSFLDDLSVIPDNVSNLVFIDDATITAQQAEKYFNNQSLISSKLGKVKKVVLLTMISTDEAIQVLNKRNITVISCIKLDERSQCFSKSSHLALFCNNHLEDCKLFATKYGEISMLGQKVPTDPLGYRNGSYAFGFFYNIPDNSLPIFWAENGNWSPIMKRYDKADIGLDENYGRFI
jgi:hypothetical protein